MGLGSDHKLPTISENSDEKTAHAGQAGVSFRAALRRTLLGTGWGFQDLAKACHPSAPLRQTTRRNCLNYG